MHLSNSRKSAKSPLEWSIIILERYSPKGKVIMAQDKEKQVTKEQVLAEIRAFNHARDWEQFHTPENLAKSISIEAGELLECFQWDADFDRQALTEEMADVYAYLLMLADRIGVDLDAAALAKYEKNKAKYPVEKAKGNSAKYDELD
jgi:NTP pyrophosphatase (non-canonical NTP hydrolase)